MVDFFAGGCLIVKMETGMGHDEVDRRLKRALRGGNVCHRALAFYLHAGSGVQLRMDFTIVETAKHPRAGRAELPEPTLESVNDIPDQIEVAWLRRHEHLLEWTPDGQKLRMKRPRGLRSSRSSARMDSI